MIPAAPLIFKAVGGWVAKNWRILAVLAAVAVLYFGARYVRDLIDEAGYNRCQGEHATAQAVATETARKEKAATDAKFKVMPITDIDRLGAARGWVRPRQDR